MKSVYLGIDNTQPNCVKIVGLTIEEAWNEETLFCFRYRGEVTPAALWRRKVESYKPKAVATTVLEHNPFTIFDCLDSLGIPIHRYDRNDLPGLGYRTPEIQPGYRFAARLAMRLAYQCEAYHKLANIDWEIWYLKEEIEKLKRACERIKDIVPCPF